RASITIASLNMNGFTAPANNMNGIEKWSSVYKTMNKNKIAILALQETHLDNDLLDNIHTCFGKRLQVINSHLPTNPRTSAGVAFIINKALIAPKELKVYELIEGRALAIKVKWKENGEAVIINVYAPNNKSDHQQFWEQVDERRRSKGIRKPDFLLGDFNLTEDPIDRSPPHDDDINAIEALRNLRQCLNLQDTWRYNNPNERAFTYRAMNNGTHRKSRLDRIYTSADAAKLTFEWKITHTSIPTDHWLVSTKFAPTETPTLGSGRWTWQLSSLKDKKLLMKIVNRGIDLIKDLDRLQNNPIDRGSENPQTLWEKFKKDIKELARIHNKISWAKLTSRMKAIEKDLKELSNNPELDNSDTIRTNEAFLANELAYLERVQERDNRDEMRAALAHHGERLGGIWSAINKDRKPRDLIYRLKPPNTDASAYERDSKRMAQMAKTYHQEMQSKDRGVNENAPEYRHKLNSTLSEIPEHQKLSEQGKESTEWDLSEEQVNRALSLAKNGTATGLDGCPYELWKCLAALFVEAEKTGTKGFDVVSAMTRVFSDIQTAGIDNRTEFAYGWMCPLYKKKDPTDISNYRPITLLNTDYKLFTKALALQL
ncbi:Endonuclease/exonuclease/phosphatase, partial [Lactarius deliciosus]